MYLHGLQFYSERRKLTRIGLAEAPLDDPLDWRMVSEEPLIDLGGEGATDPHMAAYPWVVRITHTRRHPLQVAARGGRTPAGIEDASGAPARRRVHPIPQGWGASARASRGHPGLPSGDGVPPPERSGRVDCIRSRTRLAVAREALGGLALLDANVLYPAGLRDILLRLADRRLFIPHGYKTWSRDLDALR